jgi:hypothetical protein
MYAAGLRNLNVAFVASPFERYPPPFLPFPVPYGLNDAALPPVPSPPLATISNFPFELINVPPPPPTVVASATFAVSGVGC